MTLADKPNRILRMSFDEREAWFEVQSINVQSDTGKAKLKLFRFDCEVARLMVKFIKDTEKQFKDRIDEFNLAMKDNNAKY